MEYGILVAAVVLLAFALAWAFRGMATALDKSHRATVAALEHAMSQRGHAEKAASEFVAVQFKAAFDRAMALSEEAMEIRRIEREEKTTAVDIGPRVRPSPVTPGPLFDPIDSIMVPDVVG